MENEENFKLDAIAIAGRPHHSGMQLFVKTRHLNFHAEFFKSILVKGLARNLRDYFPPLDYYQNLSTVYFIIIQLAKGLLHVSTIFEQGYHVNEFHYFVIFTCPLNEVSRG